MTDRDNQSPDTDPTPGEEFILPGGKVDPDAIRAAVGADDEDDGLTRVQFKLTRDLNKRLDKYLTDRITFMSRTQLQRLIDVGGVSVNERPPKASTKLRLGDVVDVVVPPPPSTEIQGEDIPIDVILEDEHMLVLNKQPDIIVHPARSHNRGTLLNALVYHFKHRSNAGGSLSGVGKDLARPGVVHRLDRHTSGVMVIAKDDESHWKIGRQFEKRNVDKRYLAIVHGQFPDNVDPIDIPIGPHYSRVRGLREKMIVRHDHLGKPALTIARVRQRFDNFTLMELELKTGRTHQIRVHMTFRGFPLAGDDMYEGRIVTANQINQSLPEDVVLNRQALHATLLTFNHPISGERRTFTAPLRGDMANLIRLLREHDNPQPVLSPAGATVDLDVAVGE